MFALRKTAQAGALTIRSVARSHIGKVRSVNEDRLLDCSDHRLWAIADGMGGHHLGDKAATMVVRALAQLTETPEITRSQSIIKALESANADILAMAKAAGHICGSTVAALHVRGREGTIFWAGDSRIYRLRSGKLERLTRDHSVVQDMADRGIITEAQGRRHPQSNVITRAIGIEDRSDLEHAVCSVMAGDVFVLCSDGLSGAIDDAWLMGLLTTSIDNCANQLLNAALEAGGHDNISFILVQVT